MAAVETDNSFKSQGRVGSSAIVDEVPDGADIAALPVEQIAGQLGSDLASGLTSQIAAQRLQTDGPNELRKPPMPSFIVLLVLQFLGFVIMLLIAAACASIAVNATSPQWDDPKSYTTGFAIILIVLINAAIAAKVEHKANGALDALSKMSQAQITAVRDGAEVKVETTSLVRGDIVLLDVGDIVPADVCLIEAADLKVNEMPLTGEPEDVSKTHKVKAKKEDEPAKLVPPTMCFMSCLMTNGKGKALVVQTGMQTRIGEIAEMLQGEDAGTRCFCLPDNTKGRTPLQENVDKLGARIGVMAIGVCVVVFIVGLLTQTMDPEMEVPEDEVQKYLDSALFMVLISVTLAVAAIPEGIPLCVTISLSLGCYSMVKENVLVRKLAAVETLGSASVICTDKTGTLTEGKMTMVKMWAADRAYSISGKGFNPEIGTITRVGDGADGTQDPAVRTTLFSALMCCNTTLSKNEDDPGNVFWEPKGNSTEAPMVVAAQKIGFKGDEVAKQYERVMEVPFSSSRKMMLTVSKLGGKATIGQGGVATPAGAELLAVCKGAPNFILDACTGYLTEHGTMQPLTSEKRAEIMGIVDAYSSQALRVIAVAIHTMKTLPYDPDDDELSTDVKFQRCREDLQLLGLVANIDPERNGVPDAVLKARGASIRVVMITGDYLKTAIAIAHNCNILLTEDDDERDAMDCGQLRPNGRYISHEEMDQITRRVKVFARAQPQDKMEIVTSMQRQDFVSAMTGDGVNDAPALKRADIGVAMGIQGTEVAKGASDMILEDDNFATIVTAVEKGRVIYAGIQKFVAFIMSVHIAEVMQIFVCIVLRVPVMRTPLQILFLILVTDLGPSIALGVEPGEPGILKNRPRPKTEPIMLGWMWISSTANGLILSAVIIAIYLVCLNKYCEGNLLNTQLADWKLEVGKVDHDRGLKQARTVAFIALVLSENIRAYISRSFDKPVWVKFCANRSMQMAICAADVVLCFALFLPYILKKNIDIDIDILGLDPDIGAFGYVMAFAGPVGCLVFCELFKFVTYQQLQNYQRALAKRQEEQDVAQQKGTSIEVKEEDSKLDEIDKKPSGMSYEVTYGSDTRA